MEGKSKESARVCSGETNPEAHPRFFQMTPRVKKQMNNGNLLRRASLLLTGNCSFIIKRVFLSVFV